MFFCPWRPYWTLQVVGATILQICVPWRIILIFYWANKSEQWSKTIYWGLWSLFYSITGIPKWEGFPNLSKFIVFNIKNKKKKQICSIENPRLHPGSECHFFPLCTNILHLNENRSYPNNYVQDRTVLGISRHNEKERL